MTIIGITVVRIYMQVGKDNKGNVFSEIDHVFLELQFYTLPFRSIRR